MTPMIFWERHIHSPWLPGTPKVSCQVPARLEKKKSRPEIKHAANNDNENAPPSKTLLLSLLTQCFATGPTALTDTAMVCSTG